MAHLGLGVGVYSQPKPQTRRGSFGLEAHPAKTQPEPAKNYGLDPACGQSLKAVTARGLSQGVLTVAKLAG